MAEYAGWITLWKWVLIIGLTFYFLVALYVTPFGILDIRRLFRKLDEAKKTQEPGKDSYEI